MTMPSVFAHMDNVAIEVPHLAALQPTDHQTGSGTPFFMNWLDVIKGHLTFPHAKTAGRVQHSYSAMCAPLSTGIHARYHRCTALILRMHSEAEAQNDQVTLLWLFVAAAAGVTSRTQCFEAVI